MYVWEPYVWRPQGTSDPLELELKTILSTMCVLRMKPQSSAEHLSSLRKFAECHLDYASWWNCSVLYLPVYLVAGY